MKQVKCIADIPYFTKGKLYEFSFIDKDGDIWIKEDDDGHDFFFYPDECEVIDVE